MKIGGIHDGTLYCTRGLDVGVWNEHEGFRRCGTLPNPATGVERLAFEVRNHRLSKRLLEPVTGAYTTTNLWPLGDDRLLATVSRWLFVSADGGRSWELAHELPESSGMMGVLPTSMCEHGGRVYLAEYPLGGEPARVLVSDDRGETWGEFVERSDVRHFHGLFTDPYAGRLWGTTGDTDAESAIGVFEAGGFEPVGRGSQRWRAVQLAFTPDAIYWGEDCSYTAGVGICRLPRNRLDDEAPEPDVIGTTDGPIYYAETLSTADTDWLVVSTTATPEADSTAPGVAQERHHERPARVLAAPADSGYETWYELYAVDRKAAVGEYVDPVPESNGYLFLATDPERGLVINPYNTTRANGEIVTIPPETFAERAFAPYVGPEPNTDTRRPSRA
jgi:hypothetical protein